MLTKLSNTQARSDATKRATYRAQIFMWSIWTIYMVGFAFIHWQLDLTAHRPAPVLGLVIHSLLAGLVGLIVMTLVEIRFDPERFTNV